MYSFIEHLGVRRVRLWDIHNIIILYMLHCTNEFFCLFFVFFLPLLGNMLLIEISVLNLSGHLFDGTGLHCGLQSLGLRNCHDSYVQFSTNNQKKNTFELLSLDWRWDDRQTTDSKTFYTFYKTTITYIYTEFLLYLVNILRRLCDIRRSSFLRRTALICRCSTTTKEGSLYIEGWNQLLRQVSLRLWTEILLKKLGT